MTDYTALVREICSEIKPFAEVVPRLLKMRTEAYAEVKRVSHEVKPLYTWGPIPAPYPTIDVVIDDTLDCDWILIDNKGNEMRRSEE